MGETEGQGVRDTTSERDNESAVSQSESERVLIESHIG